MDLGIAGRTALVNGGSAGMGHGAALALAREGVEVFISARGAERLEATCKAIAAETGAKVHALVADHASDEGRAAILSAIPDPDIEKAIIFFPFFGMWIKGNFLHTVDLCDDIYAEELPAFPNKGF